MTGRVPALLAIIGLCVGAAGLIIDAAMIFPPLLAGSGAAPPRSFADVFIYFWTYFTHLTNLWLVLTYVAMLGRWRWLSGLRRPDMLASAAAFITLVMLFYHVLLAPTLTMTGWLAAATYLLHYVAPLLYLLWWGLAAPHGALRWRSLPAMLAPGVAYVGWVLLRGAIVGAYPYDILDAATFGYLQVGIGVAVLLVAVSAFSAVLIGLDGWIGRRRG